MMATGDAHAQLSLRRVRQAPGAGAARDAAAHGQRGRRACRQLRAVPQRRAPARGLLRSRQWPEARPEPRHRAAARARPRDRRGPWSPSAPRPAASRRETAASCSRGSAAPPAGPARTGHEELCMAPRALGINRDGGFADHVLVPHPRYLFAYDPLPEAQACTYACSGLTAYSALKKCAPLGRRRHAAHHRRRRRRPVGRAHGGGGTRRQAGRGRDRSRQVGSGPRSRRRRLPGPRGCGGDQGLHEGQRRRGRGDRLRRRGGDVLVRARGVAQGRQAGERGPVRRLGAGR